MQEIHSTCSIPKSFSSGMSRKGLPSTHRRNGSGELDVFEAARYFSAGVEDGAGVASGVGRAMREERMGWRAERKSLDIPLQAAVRPQEPQRVAHLIREKKGKQPSSPGGRLASFLNSFLQAASKKKSKSFSSSSTTHSLKVGVLGEEGEGHGGGRRRRSISHSQSIRGSSESKSMYSSESSGFKTPSPYANTQRKLQHDKGSCSSSKCNGQAKLAAALCPPSEVRDEKRVIDEPWLSERAKPNAEFSLKGRVFIGGRLKGNLSVEEDAVCSDGFVENKWVLDRKSEEFFEKNALWFEGNKEEDYGAESDSSSDLFELKNYDLGDLSSGLPVYGTTDMEVIKRGSVIPSAAF